MVHLFLSYDVPFFFFCRELESFDVVIKQSSVKCREHNLEFLLEEKVVNHFCKSGQSCNGNWCIDTFSGVLCPLYPLFHPYAEQRPIHVVSAISYKDVLTDNSRNYKI